MSAKLKGQVLASAIERMIHAHHDAFAVELLGADAAGLPPERVAELLEMGVLDPAKLGGLHLPGLKHDVDPYLFALTAARVYEAAKHDVMRTSMLDWTLGQWKAHVDDYLDARQAIQPELPLGGRIVVEAADHAELQVPDPPAPDPSRHAHQRVPVEDGAVPPWLAPSEASAYRQAVERAGEFCRGLGNDVARELSQTVAEVWDGEDIAREVLPDKRATRLDVIREKVAEAVATSQDADSLARDLADATGDYVHNWARIAQTELQGAYNEGVVIDAIETYGKDALIARIPESGACDDCERLLIDSETDRPIVWRIEVLLGNGTNVGKKRVAWNATVWPIHPKCFPAGTGVATPGGSIPIERVAPGDHVIAPDGTVRRVSSVWASRYDGPLVELHGEGWTVSCTPNHPLLTAAGWKAAGLLQHGDHVLRQAQGRADVVPMHAAPTDAPPVAQERRLFASILSGLSPCGVPISAVYFQGQLVVWEGDVYQEPLEGETDLNLQADRPQGVGKRNLPGGLGDPGLCGDGPSDESGGTGLASDGRVSSLGERFAFARGAEVHADSLCSAPASLLLSGLVQQADNLGAVDVEAIRDCFHREQRVEVQPDHGFRGQLGVRDVVRLVLRDHAGSLGSEDLATFPSFPIPALPSERCVLDGGAAGDAGSLHDLAHGHTADPEGRRQRVDGFTCSVAGGDAGQHVGREIDLARHGAPVGQWSRIVNRADRQHKGLVYNLTVEDVACYYADGVASHNCRCGTVSVPPGFYVTRSGAIRRDRGAEAPG